jgi:sec-independent protein translocase protein TatC
LFSGLLPFSEHIAELRRRLKVVAVSFLVILLLVVFFPASPLYSIQNPGQYLNLSFLSNTLIAAFISKVKADLVPAGWQLIAANGIGEPMEIYFVASLLIAVTIDMPVIAYETYRFIDPALNEGERKMIYPFVISATALFAVGILFGYLVLAKFLVAALAPFFQATGTNYLIDAAAFYYVVFLIIAATGVSFTSPVFVYSLIRLQVLEADFFSRNRVIIWFLIWVVTGLFLTPDGGPLLDVVIFLPIVTMVEVAVFFGRRSVKGKAPKATKRGFRCPHCGADLGTPRLFCDRCGKSVA